MNTDEQRIALAEFIGWVIENNGPLYKVTAPDGKVALQYSSINRRREALFALPNFPQDRNAMHSAFLALSDATKTLCICYLYEVARSNHPDKDVALAMATLPQWSMSILRAVGKWKD